MATANPCRRLLGQILLDGGFIASHDLDLALEVQKHTQELLGQVMVEMGMLDRADLAAALSLQDNLSSLDAAVKSAAGGRRLLGSLLLLAGKITTEQLDFALAEQKLTGEKLGHILVKMGLLNGAELEAMLQFQKHQESAATSTSPLRLGKLLTASGYITTEQLAVAVQKQGASHMKLGEILVAEGFVDSRQVERGVHLQRKLLRAVLVAVISLTGMAMQSYDNTMPTYLAI